MANTKIDLESLIKKQNAENIAPIIRAIYGSESSNNTDDTSKPNSSGARGPMQVTKIAFRDMQQRGYIPKNYNWGNPLHNTEAGIAYTKYYRDKYNSLDPRLISAGYYSGPQAINKDGTINADRKDLKNPNYPTVGTYADKILNSVKQSDPAYNNPYYNVKMQATPPSQYLPDPFAPPDPKIAKQIMAADPYTLPDNYREGGRVKLI